VFKLPEDCDKILSDPKFLQKIVNRTTKKQVKSAFDQFDSDEEIDPDAPLTEAQLHENEMLEGGFTLVTEGAENVQSKKFKTTDGMGGTTMVGIS
jgi:hypothetical protein